MERKMQKENLNKYKIIKEYEKYYLTESVFEYRECFLKADRRKRYKVVDGYIYLSNRKEEEYEDEEE